MRRQKDFYTSLLEQELADPVFRRTFEREQREIRAIDGIVNQLDHLRIQNGLSKAELAREIGKNPASVRRLLTAPGNPELRTIVSVASALGAEIRIVPSQSHR